MRRDRISAVLAVLTALLTVLALVSTWVRTEALDTDQWTKTSSTVLASPAVQQATAAYLADQLTAPGTVQALQERLPGLLKPLAGPLTGQLGEVAERVTLRALRTREFQRLWEAANRLAHRQLVRIIDGGSRTRRAVVLDLRPMLGRIAARTGFGLSPLAADRAVVTILDADEVGQVQTAGATLRKLAFISTLLALLCLVATVAVAVDRRRGAVRAASAILFAGVLVLVLRRIGITAGADALAGPAGEAAPRATLRIATQLLTDLSWMVVVLGAVTLAAAWLIGPGRRAEVVRRFVRPLAGRTGVAHVVAALAVLVLVVAGLLPWSTAPLAVLIYLVAGVLFAELLRREVGAAPSG